MSTWVSDPEIEIEHDLTPEEVERLEQFIAVWDSWAQPRWHDEGAGL